MFKPPPPASAFEDLRSHYETARQQYMTDIRKQSIVWEKQKELELKKQLQEQVQNESIVWEKQREQDFINKYNDLFATEKQKLEKKSQAYVQKMEDNIEQLKDNIEQLEKEIAQLKDDVKNKKKLEKEIERLQSNLQKVEKNKKKFEEERNNILKKEQQQNKEISDCKTRTSELTLDLKDCHSRLDSKKPPTPKRPTPNKGPPPTRPTTKRTPPRASSSRDCEAQFNENYKRFETTQNIKGQLGKNSDDLVKNIEKIVRSIERKHGVSMIRKLALILHPDKYRTCSVSDNSDFRERINEATLKITQVLDEHKK